MRSAVAADHRQPELNVRPTLEELSPEECLLIRHYRGLTETERKFMLHAIICMTQSAQNE